jgi:hypothetical protein
MKVTALVQVMLTTDVRSLRTSPRLLTARIVNDRDEIVFSQDVNLIGTFDQGRQTLCSIDLPVARLTPGSYVLTFLVDAPVGLRRDVRFTVQ